MRIFRFALVVCLGIVIGLSAPHPREGATAPPLNSRADVLKAFNNPPAAYRSAPLWVWNDRITNREIEEQLSDFKAHGIGGVFIHPRPGLITPYLSEEWLSMWRHAVDVGKKLGMTIWIYDENSYPSGFAGGHVPAAIPDAVRAGLRMSKAAELPVSFEVEPLVILRKGEAGFEDVTVEAKAKGRALGSGEYYIFDINRQKPNPWYGGYTYVDLMRRDVTEKFLDVTLNAYKKAVGEEFGKTVPGVFQDEAEINPAGGQGLTVVNYTPALFEAFRKKWGYDLKLHLPSVFEDTGDWRRVRHNFFGTLLDLFIDNWAVPYYDYCTRNGLIFTGHYWEHEWPRPVVNPDNLAFCAYAHMPGIDILMNDFQTDTHAQFGNARAVKEIRSAANQLGRERTMSETFGAGGWDMTFLQQKRIADWEYALGVNFINQHLSYVTIKGARKRDHPLSFSYHEPWWSAYNILADYYGRLSVALCAGEQVNRVLVLEPTTTAWMFQSPRAESGEMKALGKEFQDFINALEAAQVEYDLGSEYLLAKFGQAGRGALTMGRRSYELVILPPGLKNMNEPTAGLLRDYLAGGGKLLSWPEPPSFIDGNADGRMARLAAEYPRVWFRAGAGSGLADIKKLISSALAFESKTVQSGQSNLLFHHRRTLKDAEIVFLANTDDKNAAAGTMTGAGMSCERWDPFTGKTAPYPFKLEGGKLDIAFDLPPGGSLLLCLKAEPGESGKPAAGGGNEMKAQRGLAVARESANILTLDYCDLTLGGRTEKDLYFYEAQLKTFRHHGLDRNPWDSAVQFKTSIVDKDAFPSGSGFEATYRFTVPDGIPAGSLRAVVERPEIFQVVVNGRTCPPLKGQWWLDQAFGVFDLGSFVKAGENQMTLKASPFTLHAELEPVYILGDFGVEKRNRGFEIVAASPLGLGEWTAQNMPFYSGGIAYKKVYSLNSDDFRGNRFFVELGGWRGAVAEVRVNGRKAGSIAFDPFRLDITDALTPGVNEVAVVVYGTLKNTLGPHHNNPRLGSAWPGSFQQGAKDGYPPGSEYSFVGYGLFEDFKVIEIRE
jgi:hypothetical protein